MLTALTETVLPRILQLIQPLPRGVIVHFLPSAIAAPVLQREDSKADVRRWKSNNELILHLAFI